MKNNIKECYEVIIHNWKEIVNSASGKDKDFEFTHEGAYIITNRVVKTHIQSILMKYMTNISKDETDEMISTLVYFGLLKAKDGHYSLQCRAIMDFITHYAQELIKHE